MAMKKNYHEISKQLLKLVGGKENIGYFTQCITRLRFDVKDKSLVKVAELGKIDGVLGAQWLGDQIQVVIGQDVEKVYSAVCEDAGFTDDVL